MGKLAFFRSSDRKAPHKPIQMLHTFAGIDAMGYSQEYKEDYEGHYLFAEDGVEIVPEDGITANTVKLDNSQITIHGMNTMRHPGIQTVPVRKGTCRSAG